MFEVILFNDSITMTPLNQTSQEVVFMKIGMRPPVNLPPSLPTDGSVLILEQNTIDINIKNTIPES